MNSVTSLILEMIIRGNVVEGTAALMEQPMMDSLTILNQVLYAGGRADNPMLMAEKDRLLAALPEHETGEERRNILYNLGCIAVFQDEILEAQQYFRQTIEIAPDMLPAWHNLAYAHELMADHTTALNLYQMVLSYDPTFLLSRINHSLLLLSMGETGAGLDALRELDRNYPANKGVRLYLTRTLLAQNNEGAWNEAVSLLSEMPDLNNWYPFRAALAYGNFRLGRMDEAQTQLQALLEDHPEDVFSLTGMVRLRALDSDLPGVAQYLERLHAAKPSDATADLLLGLREAGHAA